METESFPDLRLKFTLFIGALSPLFTMRVIPEPAQILCWHYVIALSYRSAPGSDTGSVGEDAASPVA